MQKVLISSALAGAVWSKKATLDNLGDVNGKPNRDDTTSADFTENDKAHFLEWTATHGKHYTDAQEFEKRQRNWFDTELEIRRKGNSTFKLAHNKFSDWSKAEKDAILTLRTPFDQPASSPPIANRKRTNVTISCATGEYVFYNRNTGADECRSCDYGCDECIDSRTCLKCSSSTMQVSKLGKCQCDGRNMFLNGNTGDCEECPAGTGLYRRFNICVPCGANCSECKTWNKCGTCEPGFTFTLGQCYADLCSRDDLLMNADGECVCKRGYHDTGSVCVYCP